MTGRVGGRHRLLPSAYQLLLCLLSSRLLTGVLFNQTAAVLYVLLA